MEEKVFKPLDELIDLLEQRGVEFKDPAAKDYAKNVLEKHGYYNIINGYNKLFLDFSSKEIKYKPGTTMNEINALYQFDRVLRDIFLRYILIIETHIKSLISYYFSEAHGHKNYLIYTNFNMSVKDSSSKITNLIADIQKQVAYRSDDPSIAHYLKNHGYIPLWVINNILTLGLISKFYSLMIQSERQCISKHFNILDNELESALMYISSVRNFCAHGNRLYCFNTKRRLVTTSYHIDLEIDKDKQGEFLNGKHDLFACLIAMKLLLSNNDFKRMSKEIYRAIGTLNKKLNVLSKDEILKEMGFPQTWRKLNDL